MDMTDKRRYPVLVVVLAAVCGTLGGCGSGGGASSSELSEAEANVAAAANRYPSGFEQVCAGWADFGEDAYVEAVEEHGYGKDVPYPSVEPGVMAGVITRKCDEEVGNLGE